nr:hypothetical protein CFP56_07524 [Quercus suber]
MNVVGLTLSRELISYWRYIPAVLLPNSEQGDPVTVLTGRVNVTHGKMHSLSRHLRPRQGLHDRIKPYHWIYFIQLKVEGDKNFGISHQLRVMPGNFHYEGPEELDLGKFGDPKEVLEVGEVDLSRIVDVYGILKQVRIDTVESSGWNCQDWTLDGLDDLKKGGFVHDSLTREGVKHWLKEI